MKRVYQRYWKEAFAAVTEEEIITLLIFLDMLVNILTLRMLIELVFGQNWQKLTNLTGMVPYYSEGFANVPHLGMLLWNIFQSHKHC